MLVFSVNLCALLLRALGCKPEDAPQRTFFSADKSFVRALFSAIKLAARAAIRILPPRNLINSGAARAPNFV
jgi:hypothetical protein